MREGIGPDREVIMNERSNGNYGYICRNVVLSQDGSDCFLLAHGVTNGEETTGYAGRMEARYGEHLLPFMMSMRTYIELMYFPPPLTVS